MSGQGRLVTPQALYEVYWASGSASGTLHVWAPDGDTALATVRESPSMHGIPHEHPIVGHATRIRVREAGRLFNERAA